MSIRLTLPAVRAAVPRAARSFSTTFARRAEAVATPKTGGSGPAAAAAGAAPRPAARRWGLGVGEYPRRDLGQRRVVEEVRLGPGRSLTPKLSPLPSPWRTSLEQSTPRTSPSCSRLDTPLLPRIARARSARRSRPRSSASSRSSLLSRRCGPSRAGMRAVSYEQEAPRGNEKGCEMGTRLAVIWGRGARRSRRPSLARHAGHRCIPRHGASLCPPQMAVAWGGGEKKLGRQPCSAWRSVHCGADVRHPRIPQLAP